MKTLILLLTLFIISAFGVSAQQKVVISTDPPLMAMKLPVVKEVGKAKAKYNERTGKTILETGHSQVFGVWDDGISLQASAELTGKEVVKPALVGLVFNSMAKNRRYADNRALKITADGKVIFSGIAKFLYGNTNGEFFSIGVSQDLPYETYKTLANSKSVKIKIGPAQFELKEADFEALKDLIRLVE